MTIIEVVFVPFVATHANVASVLILVFVVSVAAVLATSLRVRTEALALVLGALTRLAAVSVDDVAIRAMPPTGGSDVGALATGFPVRLTPVEDSGRRETDASVARGLVDVAPEGAVAATWQIGAIGKLCIALNAFCAFARRTSIRRFLVSIMAR